MSRVAAPRLIILLRLRIHTIFALETRLTVALKVNGCVARFLVLITVRLSLCEVSFMVILMKMKMKKKKTIISEADSRLRWESSSKLSISEYYQYISI